MESGLYVSVVDTTVRLHPVSPDIFSEVSLNLLHEEHAPGLQIYGRS